MVEIMFVLPVSQQM